MIDEESAAVLKKARTPKRGRHMKNGLQTPTLSTAWFTFTFCACGADRLFNMWPPHKGSNTEDPYVRSQGVVANGARPFRTSAGMGGARQTIAHASISMLASTCNLGELC